MKRPFDWHAFSDHAHRDSWACFYLSVAICCLFGIAAITRVYATPVRQETTQQGVPAITDSERITNKTKLAEGEYEIYEEGNSGAVGPAGEEVYDFHESWTLWRNGKEQYEVVGERNFESPRDVQHANRFLVELSRDLTPIRRTEFANLKWRIDSGPLTCEFLRAELHCSSGARNAKDSIDLRVPMEFPYGFLWPISPFSLSGLTRQAERDLNRPTSVQLLSIEQPGPDDPISPTVRDGQFQYLGDEDINVAEQVWRAHKFSLKVASQPQFLIWTSANGLLLSLAGEHAHPNWPKEGMKLARFHKWADF
jgi:hypothetical protein